MWTGASGDYRWVEVEGWCGPVPLVITGASATTFYVYLEYWALGPRICCYIHIAKCLSVRRCSLLYVLSKVLCMGCTLVW